jgi:hypothetical protein
MSSPLSHTSISTKHKTGDETKAADARQPNERDESPDDAKRRPQKKMLLAAKDVASGLVDTELRDRPDQNPKNNAPTLVPEKSSQKLPDGSDA